MEYGGAGPVATLVPRERRPRKRALPDPTMRPLSRDVEWSNWKSEVVVLQVKPQVIVVRNLERKVAGSSPARDDFRLRSKPALNIGRSSMCLLHDSETILH